MRPRSPLTSPATPLRLQAVGDELLDSVASDNIPIFAEEEKFNAAITTSVDRLDAKLSGNAVPGGFGARPRGRAACAPAPLCRPVSLLGAAPPLSPRQQQAR
jgi:hypothetical protein